VKSWNLENSIEALQSLLMILIEFVLMFFAVRYLANGLITLGTVVLLQFYMLQLLGGFWEFAKTVRHIYRSIADAEEMVTILQTPQEIKDLPDALDLRPGSGRIEFKRIDFGFHVDHRVFSGFNFEIASGEKVALIGPSGAGKSTIVKLLLRLYEPDRGRISIDGQDIAQVTQQSLRRCIGLVPQDPILFHRTLMENIRYGRAEASDEEVKHAAKQAHCEEFIVDLPQGYETYVGERGIKLSGGERQRIAIARAILKNAPILVLEAAPGLEPSEDGQGEIEQQLAMKEVFSVMQELRPEDREIITMRYVDELEPREIAELLGITPNNASVRVSRAITALRKLLEEQP
jgi:RNA polymerase sigma factor (sigma-70 family)